MEKGSIKFIYEDGKSPSLEIELANNNLWLTKHEIAYFLNCFVQKIDAGLRSIFAEKLLWEDDCCYCNRYIDKGLEKQTMYYNLEVLIFISYRINTLEAKAFRQLIGFSLRKQLKKSEKPKERMKMVWFHSSKLNYLWN